LRIIHHRVDAIVDLVHGQKSEWNYHLTLLETADLVRKSNMESRQLFEDEY